MAQGPPSEMELLHHHLMTRWLLWGLLPLGICAAGMFIAAAAASHGPIEGKQATRMAFEIVLGFGGALFLAAFYLDGHWTAAERVARRIYIAAGGDTERQPSSWAQSPHHRGLLAEQAAIAMNSIKASADAVTLMGSAIGISAIVTVLMGLSVTYGLQMLAFGLFYQLFIFSRHPYYERLADAATRGELLPPDSEEKEEKK